MKTTFPLFLAVLLAGFAFSPAQGQIRSILTPVEPVTVEPVKRTLAAGGRATAMRLGETELFERLARALTERLALTDGELTLLPVSPWIPVEMPAGTWAATLIEAPDLKKLGSNFFLRFRVESGDQLIGEWQMPVKAQFTQEVWVATRQLSRGVTPNPDTDLEKRRLNVLVERQPPIAARNPLDGYEFAQSVTAGQPLTWRDLSPRALVRRGQSVEVVAGGGPFSISMKALALQDGANGAIVRVRNTTSQRDIDARVVGSGKVQVSF